MLQIPPCTWKIVMISLLLARPVWADVVAVPASAALASDLPPYGRGFCAQFTKGRDADGLSTTADALHLLDDLHGAPYRYDPDWTFYGVVPVCDLMDGYDTTTGRQLDYNAWFPWSDPDDRWTTATCQSHGGTLGSNKFAVRFRGDLLVKAAGTYTFSMRTDDGYQMSIGDLPVMATTGLRSAAVDTQRVSFAAAGVYPIEIVYFENDGHAVFEAMVAATAVSFVADSNEAAVAADPASGVDLHSRQYAVLPPAFTVLGSDSVDLPTWLDAGSDDCSELVGQPSDICTMPAANSSSNCGNGRIDAFSDGGAEACDDGNHVDGDGCSSTCTLEDGYLCDRLPSHCSTDIDGDGVPNSVEATNGTDPRSADSDRDGLSDADEASRGTNPLSADTDGDGVSDGDEVSRGTNPLSADTDANGSSNGGGGATGGSTGSDGGAGAASGGNVNSGDNASDAPAVVDTGASAQADNGNGPGVDLAMSGGGCAATSPSSMMPFAMLAVVLLHMRRRGQQPRIGACVTEARSVGRA